MAFKASDSFTYRKDRSCPVKFYLVTHTHSRESAPSRRKFDSDKKIRVPYSFWLQRIPLQNLQPYVNFRPLWEKRGYNVGQSKEAVRVTQVGVRWRHSKPQMFATFRKLTVTAILQDTSCKVCVEGLGWRTDITEGDNRSKRNKTYSLCPWSRVLPEKLSVSSDCQKSFYIVR